MAEVARCIVAVDGGGTGCRAGIFSLSKELLGSAEGDSANITTDFDASRENILSTVRHAYNDAQRPEDNMQYDVACLGVAGANVGNASLKLKSTLPFGVSQVLSDREITVQGALGEHDGAVAQVGTGSFFSVRRSGKWQHAGGWGFQLSDDCSGAYLGRKLLRATVAAYDGLVERSALTQNILNQFGGSPNELVQFIQSATPRDYGSFVPALIAAHQEDDVVANAILLAANGRLVSYLDALDVLSTNRLCLTGGVASVYQALLPTHYQNLLADPLGSGLDGAYSLALEILPN